MASLATVVAGLLFTMSAFVRKMGQGMEMWEVFRIENVWTCHSEEWTSVQKGPGQYPATGPTTVEKE